MFQLILATVLFGQCSIQPVEVVGPYSRPDERVEYFLGGAKIDSRVSVNLYYGEKHYSVPVINGYAPEMNVSLLPSGTKLTIYDYRNKVDYKKCKQYIEKKVPEKQSVLPQEKGLVPIPDLLLDLKTGIARVWKESKEAKPAKEPLKTKAPKLDLSSPILSSEEMTSPLPPMQQTAQPKEEEMISPLPPQSTSKETKPRAPKMELSYPSEASSEVSEPNEVFVPEKVIKPTYK